MKAYDSAVTKSIYPSPRYRSITKSTYFLRAYYGRITSVAHDFPVVACLQLSHNHEKIYDFAILVDRIATSKGGLLFCQWLLY